MVNEMLQGVQISSYTLAKDILEIFWTSPRHPHTQTTHHTHHVEKNNTNTRAGVPVM